jgi:decaprenylphospho-beta-D-ribofuranose 2-oxidase
MHKYKRGKISGWGNYPIAESYITFINSKAEAINILDREVIPRGLGRSYSDQAINTDRLVANCTKLNKMLSFDADIGILECETGVSLEDVIKTFAPRGWFPLICPGTKFVTIGGAIANDIHGKAHHVDGSFVNCVHSFTILLADRTIVNASRTENSDLFWANFGGLGLLGIILSAKIQLRKIETTYFKQKSMAIKNLDHLLVALEEYANGYNYSLAWIDPLAKGNKLGSGVLTVGNAATINDLPSKLKSQPLKLHADKKVSLPFYLPNFALNDATSRVLNWVMAYLLKNPGEIVHYEKYFFPLDMFNNWNRGYGKRGFIQYQFVIPKDTGKGHLRTILESISSSGCTPFLNVFKTMGKGQGILSFPFEGYTLAIDFPVSAKLKQFIPTLDSQVLAANGRIYLGKDAFLSKETFYKMYPQADEWLRVKEKYDPANLFTSDFSRRIGLHSSNRP